MPRWFDSHCHLQDESDFDGIVARAHEAGVERAICVGTNYETSLRGLEIARAQANTGLQMWSTVGLHPHEASIGTDRIADLVHRTVQPPEAGGRHSGAMVAVGECGLDYYYEHSPREEQRDAFTTQIVLARELGLTLVVHTRDAWDDTLAILAGEGVPERTIVHCFSGGSEEARRCLDLGAYLSFSGIVTFKKADDVRDAARLCPPDRLLVETDAPYLAPVPFRGQKNEPAHVALVGSAVAELRSVAAEDLAETTTQNAAAAFGICW